MTSPSSQLDRERKLLELLSRALELEDEAREELLTGIEPTLARQVRTMLSESTGGDSFHAHRFSVEAVAEEPILAAGAQIGQYRVVEPLGSGGMGRVYLAEQSRPVRRRVAIKLLPVYLADAKLRRRFAVEQQAMERLDHPNVGKILDAGTTEDGAPYLVMELIEGEPIDLYCDRRGLGLELRLRLLVEVCRGVAHAHRRFLLHRDIKPSNVLVTEVDGKPLVKLIDFGIAKALDVSLETQLTGGHAIGTPSYMSPEALHGAEVDIRSDVFSLGVLLARLLTGHLPWEGKETNFAGHLKQRMEVPATSPSRRVSRLEPEVLARRAELCGETPASLLRRLRGDLDAITGRAIAEQPTERYSSVDALADDLERHLAHEPVAAHPRTPAYLGRKAYRRHRTGILAALTLSVVLAAVLFATALDLAETRRDLRQARAALGEGPGFTVEGSTSAGNAVAGSTSAGSTSAGSTNTDSTSAGNAAALGSMAIRESVVTGELARARLHLDRGEVGPARDLAVTALASARTEPARAEALALLGSVQRRLGAFTQAQANLLEALDLYRRLDGTPIETVARVYRELGASNLDAWKYDQAIGYLEEARALYERALPGPALLEKDAAGGEVDIGAELAAIRLELALAYLEVGREEEARRALRGALDAAVD